MKIEDIYKGSLDGAINKINYLFNEKIQKEFPGK